MDKTSNRFKAVKKVSCNLNNGEDVYFVGYYYHKTEYNISCVIYINTPFFACVNPEFISVRAIGVFNVDEENKKIEFSVSDLKLRSGEYVITDVWTAEQLEFTDKAEFDFFLHESRLLIVNKKMEFRFMMRI